METHNACIYHCLACGRVVHAELDAKPPQCCGQTMTKTCSETVPNGDVPEDACGHSETALPVKSTESK